MTTDYKVTELFCIIDEFWIVGWMTLLYNFYRWDDIKRIYADAIDGNVYHYRDANGLECDAVVDLRNGSYGLIEIKLITVNITLQLTVQHLCDTCTTGVGHAHISCYASAQQLMCD